MFDAKTGELLGAHMIGAEVTELIQGYAIATTLETTEAELMDDRLPAPDALRDDARERARRLRQGPPHLKRPTRPARFAIRELAARDKAAWLDLWKGYCDFYEVAVADDVTEATWARLLDPAQPMMGLVACNAEDRPVALAHCVVHLNTWTEKPVGYLEDLLRGARGALRRGGAGADRGAGRAGAARGLAAALLDDQGRQPPGAGAL